MYCMTAVLNTRRCHLLNNRRLLDVRWRHPAQHSFTYPCCSRKYATSIGSLGVENFTLIYFSRHGNLLQELVLSEERLSESYTSTTVFKRLCPTLTSQQAASLGQSRPLLTDVSYCTAPTVKKNKSESPRAVKCKIWVRCILSFWRAKSQKMFLLRSTLLYVRGRRETDTLEPLSSPRGRPYAETCLAAGSSKPWKRLTRQALVLRLLYLAIDETHQHAFGLEQTRTIDMKRTKNQIWCPSATIGDAISGFRNGDTELGLALWTFTGILIYYNYYHYCPTAVLLLYTAFPSATTTTKNTFACHR